MKVLLTGASGFIGSHMLEHILRETDWYVVCVCSWKHRGTPERIEEVLNGKEWRKRVTVITHDLISPFTEKTKQRIGKCDYIINCASESHVDRSIEEPVEFILNNINVALTLLEFAADPRYAPEAFVQISTDEVYGVAPEGVYHKEWSSIVPSNPYSASKAAQEALAIAYWRTYRIPLIITNTMNNFGEMQDTEKFIPKIIRAVMNGSTVSIHGTEESIGSRFYMHARNHADAVLWLLKNTTPTKFKEGDTILPDRYNVVGDVEVNNLEMAQIIARILERPLKYELVNFHKTRPGHDRRYALDGTKLADLGWKAPYGFQQSLEKYVHWTLAHPNWL